MKIYIASSWRNGYQPFIVKKLREKGYEVYDFRHPDNNDNGFHWSEIDKDWQNWDVFEYRKNLKNPIAELGYKKDFNAMEWADIGVLVLPSGRSSHLEAGYFVGAHKPLFIYCSENIEPELMYKMSNDICTDYLELLERLEEIDKK